MRNYGEAAVEAWARSKGISEKEIEKARRCLRIGSVAARHRQRIAVEKVGCKNAIPDSRGRRAGRRNRRYARPNLHRLTFFDGASVPAFDRGHWWLAFHEAAAGRLCRRRAVDARPSMRDISAASACCQRTADNALQLRLMRATELRARRNGWSWHGVGYHAVIVASANNFIRAGAVRRRKISPDDEGKRRRSRAGRSAGATPRDGALACRAQPRRSASAERKTLEVRRHQGRRRTL